MTETPIFPGKRRRRLVAVIGCLINAAALAACGSRFTSSERTPTEDATWAGGGSASTGAVSNGGTTFAIGGRPSNSSSSGGGSTGGAAPAQAGADAESGRTGVASPSAASGSAGAINANGGTFGGLGGALIATSGNGGVVGTSPCTPALMIDDMEDGDDRSCPNQGRNGEWWASTGTTVGSIDPPKTGEFPAYALGADARLNSSYGMRLSGKGFGHADADWASLGFNLIDDAAYDLTPYQGLAFFAKSKAGTLTLHVAFATDSTTATAEGGACPSKCNDHWSKPVSIDGTWHEFTIPFSALAQEGWGVKPKDLLHTRFVFFGFLGTDGEAAEFDYLIDDVRLY